MYIKHINNVIGYKNIPDGFNMDFDKVKNYIIGANFQGKTTIGSLFNWCLTGTTLEGKERDNVSNDTKKVDKVVVDISFVDNYGIEHRLIRNKAKDFYLTLDGQEINQERLAQFYKDKDVFLVAHNPYYFWMLEPKEQKNLIRKILPSIDAKASFNLLDRSEQNILGYPIENLTEYTDSMNKDIAELDKEYQKNIGIIETLKGIILNNHMNFLEFNKDGELNQLKQQYQELSNNIETFSLEELKKNIDTIDKRLKELISNDLAKISSDYKKEESKLKELDSDESICPYCKQSMKNGEAKIHLKNFYKKELNQFQEKADNLKQRAKELISAKNEKVKLYEKLNTSNTKELSKKLDELKEKIDVLEKEKNTILLHNKQAEIINNQAKEAREKLSIYEKVQEENRQEVKLKLEQKKIANKLKILVIEAQKEKIRQYMNKVDIEFSKVSKTTGEITECCNIQYEGRDYKKLSKSQQARACLEISNVFNKITNINVPIFFDDAESTTDIQEIPNTQMIISQVIKYNKLEILYDYNEVLERKEKSIQKEIEEKSCYELELVA